MDGRLSSKINLKRNIIKPSRLWKSYEDQTILFGND